MYASIKKADFYFNDSPFTSISIIIININCTHFRLYEDVSVDREKTVNVTQILFCNTTRSDTLMVKERREKNKNGLKKFYG